VREAIVAEEGDRESGAREGEASRLWMHFAFGAAYVVLLLRLLPFFISLDAGGWLTACLKTAGGIFAGQFSESLAMFEDDPRMVVPDIIFALIVYGSTHYAVTSRLPEDGDDSRMLKFMYFCRSVLYLLVTLLVMLVILRMFILIYHDLTWPRVGVLRTVGTAK
jgi:Trk-type K+ transport system membrane component